MRPQQPYNQDAYVEPLPTTTTDAPPPSLDEAIRRTQALLLSQQFPEGYWWAELDCYISIISQTVMLYKILGVDQGYPLSKMEAYIRQQLCRPSSSSSSHAYWEVAYGHGGDLSMTVEAYMALRLLGVPPSDPDLADSLRFILSHGGASASRVFTKICLALLGCFDWGGIPALPPWFMLFPASFVTSIYHMSYWARTSVVPLFIILDKKPIFPVRIGSATSATLANFDELFTEGSCRNAADLMPSFSWGHSWRTNLFVGVDRMLKALERFGVVPFRERGLSAAEKWVLERQEESGDWGGIFPAMFYGLLCLHTLGYPANDPVMHRGMEALIAFSVEDPEFYRVQACVSPVWDTALVVRSLIESGVPADHPALRSAGKWLLQKQILLIGDWFFKNPTNNMCGWTFQFFNSWYPDLDDSAVVIMALDAIRFLPKEEALKQGAIGRAIKWITSMQCNAGGWAAFDKNCDQRWLNEMPFGDLRAMIDPNTVDVTARVLEMAGRLRLSSKDNLDQLLAAREVIERGVEYLRREQEAEGCWWGRWGVNYIYGTSGAMAALALIGGTECEDQLARAAKWLVKVQNKKDGGWGETCLTYRPYLRTVKKGRMDGDESEGSTASQTSWAIMGLLSAGEALGTYEMEAIERGVGFLLRSQRADGSWYERSFTGTGFPGHLYLRYHYYAQHFPLTALSRYRSACLRYPS